MLTSTPYAAAISSVIVCLSLSSLLAIGFLMVVMFSAAKIIQLWFEGSQLSHRKRVFLRILACNLTRYLWYTMSSYHLLPENYDGIYVDITKGIFPPLIERFSYSTWRSLSHFLYLWPIALLFTSASWILLNWFQLYQREKLLKKLAPGTNSSKLTPKERRKKSEYKQKKLYWFHLTTSTIVHSVTIALAPLSLRRDLLENYRWLAFMKYLNPEALLACVCFIALIGTYIYACRILGSMKLALSDHSDSEKLKLQSTFVLLAYISLFLYYIIVIFSQLATEIFQSAASDVVHTHTILRIFEMLHNVLILSILASPSLSNRAPFPSKASEITQDWLTRVLRDNGTIKSTTTVVAFSTTSLYGGCHFKVARVHLKYSVEKPDDPHKTIIVKLLTWDKSLLEKIILYVKYMMGSMDKEAMYLASYRIESLFYKDKDIKHGFHTPEVYYNLEDVFNNRFGMILQDLSKHDDGQPGGFSYDASKAILSSLAKFHVYNRGKAFGEVDGWKRAGYWTGNKREAAKHSIADAWQKVMVNFPDMNLPSRYPFLGGLLHDKLSWMEEEFESLTKQYRTMCHGDFKISNLFVGEPKPKKVMPTVYVIDFQWFGYGNGLVDAVYFLYTSVRPEDLPRLPELLMHYYNELKANGMDDYEEKVFLEHAGIVFVDFAVYVICSKWAAMTPTDMKQYELKVKDGLHLRSTAHMELILKETHRLVCEWSKRPSQMVPRKKQINSQN